MFKDLSGYKLLHDGNGTYKLVSSKGTFKGTAEEVMSHAVIEYGFDRGELETGMSEMAENSHDAAEYGMFRMFMWSYNQGESNEASATHH